MNNNLEIKTVPFMGADLMAARDNDGKIWAGVSYICNGIGLSKSQKDTQIQNVQKDRVLSRGCLKFQAGVFDPHNTTIALALDFVPLWLAKISITPSMEEDTPDLAERLGQYQLRAKDVLAEAFLPRQYQEPKSAMEYLRIQSQALFELDDRVTELEDKVDNQMTIDHGQQRRLQQLVGERVYERAAMAFPPKEVKANVGPFFKAIYKDLKNRFGVASYRDIKPMDYTSAIDYVEAWIEPAECRDRWGQGSAWTN